MDPGFHVRLQFSDRWLTIIIRMIGGETNEAPLVLQV